MDEGGLNSVEEAKCGFDLGGKMNNGQSLAVIG